MFSVQLRHRRTCLREITLLGDQTLEEQVEAAEAGISASHHAPTHLSQSLIPNGFLGNTRVPREGARPLHWPGHHCQPPAAAPRPAWMSSGTRADGAGRGGRRESRLLVCSLALANLGMNEASGDGDTAIACRVASWKSSQAYLRGCCVICVWKPGRLSRSNAAVNLHVSHQKPTNTTGRYTSAS